MLAATYSTYVFNYFAWLHTSKSNGRAPHIHTHKNTDRDSLTDWLIQCCFLCRSSAASPLWQTISKHLEKIQIAQSVHKMKWLNRRMIISIIKVNYLFHCLVFFFFFVATANVYHDRMPESYENVSQIVRGNDYCLIICICPPTDNVFENLIESNKTTTVWHFSIWIRFIDCVTSRKQEGLDSHRMYEYYDQLNRQSVTHVLKLSAHGDWVTIVNYASNNRIWLMKARHLQMSNKGLKFMHWNAVVDTRHNSQFIQMANNSNCANSSCIKWPSI